MMLSSCSEEFWQGMAMGGASFLGGMASSYMATPSSGWDYNNVPNVANYVGGWSQSAAPPQLPLPARALRALISARYAMAKEPLSMIAIPQPMAMIIRNIAAHVARVLWHRQVTVTLPAHSVMAKVISNYNLFS